jgi:hypothetical protein
VSVESRGDPAAFFGGPPLNATFRGLERTNNLNAVARRATFRWPAPRDELEAQAGEEPFMVSSLQAFNPSLSHVDAPASKRTNPFQRSIGFGASTERLDLSAVPAHPVARLAVGTSLNGRASWIPTEFAHSRRWTETCRVAQIVDETGGFETHTFCLPVTTAQIWLTDCPDSSQAAERIRVASAELLQASLCTGTGQRIPIGCIPALKLVDRGRGIVEAHLYVERADDVCSRVMRGAAEAIAPRLAHLAESRRTPDIQHGILENERVRARCRLRLCRLWHGQKDRSAPHKSGAWQVMSRLDRLEREFATDRHQPDLAALHNGHVLEGLAAAAAGSNVDPACFTLDARSYAARWGSCEPLARWRISGDQLLGEFSMPVDLATVSDSLSLRVQHEVSFQTVRDVVSQVAAIGLASSIAYLRWTVLAGRELVRPRSP